MDQQYSKQESSPPDQANENTSEGSSTFSETQNEGHPELQNPGVASSAGSERKWFEGLREMFRPPSPVPQISYVHVEESDAPKEVIYRESVARSSHESHVVTFNHPTKIICGIACVPKDTKTASPEVNILRGGTGFNYIEIRLTPVKKGYWACGIEVMGRDRNEYDKPKE